MHQQVEGLSQLRLGVVPVKPDPCEESLVEQPTLLVVCAQVGIVAVLEEIESILKRDVEVCGHHAALVESLFNGGKPHGNPGLLALQ